MIVGLPAAGYAAPPLLGHWTFDEGTGTIAHDRGPSHYDGTLSPTGASWATGVAGGAISLDAAHGAYVNMGPVLNNLAGTSYTIGAWVNTSIVNETNQIVVASHNAYWASGYILGVNTSGAYGKPEKAWFYNGGPGEVSPYSSLTVVDGTWHHLVGVRDAAKGIVSLYVDGIFQSSYADQGLGNTFSGTPLLVGAVYDFGLFYSRYTGLIDDVQIYGAALSDRDIQFLFKNPGRTVPSSSPGIELLLLLGDD